MTREYEKLREVNINVKSFDPETMNAYLGIGGLVIASPTFKQKFDSTYVFMIEPVKYQQIAAVNIKDECGYFEISYNKVALCRFQIRENKIEVIGVMFDNTGHIRVQSLFINDKLNGVTMIYDKQGIIQEILLYRNGKYKKHLYHIAAKTRKDIVRGNKKSHDPFIEHIITM